MKYNNVVKITQEYGMETIAQLSAAMKSQGSQTLYDSLDAQTKEDLNYILLEIKGPQAIYYFSEGRSAGRFPPLASISKWMQSRNIDMAALYPICRKIATLGTKQKATHFLNIWKLTPEFESDIMQAYILDIEIALTEYIDNLNAKK